MAEPGRLVEARGVTLAFDGREVLSTVDLTLRAGEIVTLIGLNGSGKTTLVRVLLGLLDGHAGSVRRRPGLRIGYMPQRLAVDPVLPLTVHRFMTLAGGAAAEAALAETGIADLAGRQVHGLSGGELQRLLLARALSRSPDLLVLDEPVQGVDVTGQAALYNLIARIRDRHGCGVLLVSHDIHLVMAAADRVVCLNHHVCCAGTPQAVTRDPEYLALFGSAAAASIARYTHHHDHRHGPEGEIVPMPESPDAG